MKSAVGVVTIIVAAGLAAGCGEPLSYCPAGAPLVNDGPGLKLDWPSRRGDRLTQGPKEGPTILVQARFISAEPAVLKDAGLTTASPAEVLKQADLESRLARVQSAASGAILQAPRLVVASGQSACVVVSSERPLIVGYDHKPAPIEKDEPDEKAEKGQKREKKVAKGSFVPVKMMLPEGTALEVSVRAEGDEAVFTELKPRLVGLIAMRQCSATVAVGKDEARVKWQEPLVLVGAGRLPSPCSIRLKAGEGLLVPLAYTIHETSSDARALVKGKVQEELSGAEGRRDASTPGKRPCVVVLSAEVMKAKAGTGNREPGTGVE